VEGYEKSIALAQQALAIEPDYAPAWRLLAVNYSNQVVDGLRAGAEAARLNREAIEKAIAADPDYALAYASLGTSHLNFDLDFVTGARHMQRAMELDSTDINVLANAANMVQAFGRQAQAIAIGEYVVVRDPVNSLAHANLGGYYLGAGRFDEAIAASRTALDLSPGFTTAHASIGLALLHKGDPDAALAEIEREPAELSRLHALAVVQHARGEHAASDAALRALEDEFGQLQPTTVASAYAMRHEPDRAFEWLGKATAVRDSALSQLLADRRRFPALVDDPRWRALLEQLHMTPEQLDAIPLEIRLPSGSESP